MTDEKKIVFKIAKDGELTVEGQGFKGQSCLEKSKKYLSGLGLATDQRKTREYFEEEQVETAIYN